ncbi:MAG: DNA-binding protein [Oceanospirillaceae bacterium]|nr:DNA-binding protein [Oceanospirillaceae bacterium]
MIDEVLKDQVFRAADTLLMSGQSPSAAMVAERLEVGVGAVDPCMALWWQSLSGRISFAPVVETAPDVPMPDTLSGAFQRIWQQAVQEATAALALEKRHAEYGAEAERRVSEDALKQSHDHYLELEARFREQGLKLERAINATRTAEAEVALLKNNLGTEAARLAKEEARRSHAEQELEQLRKTHEDTKRGFDQRVKEEQRQNLEALSKADADVRFHRSSLEKLRDEFGKKEAMLSRDITELHSQVAKRDSRLETQKSHIQGLEDDLKQLQQESTVQSRELAKVNAALLSEQNRAKRLEDQVKKLEADLKQQAQRQLSTASEATRRENALRVQLQAKEEELLRANAKVISLEKRLITQDDELKRVSARQM